MARYTPGARAWIIIVAVACAAATLLRLDPAAVNSAHLTALVLLTTCAAVASAFPIRSALGAASFQLASLFFIAGSVILPSSFCTLLPLLALTPGTWRRRHTQGVWVRWTFNVTQT